MAEQSSAQRSDEMDEFLDESPFRSSLRSVLVVDLALLSVWTAWAHAGPGGISRLALVIIWSIPALWNVATRPMLRKLTWRRVKRGRRQTLFLVACVGVITTLLTLTTTLSDSVSRSARAAVDTQLGSIDEMILAPNPEVRLAAQSRLDQVLSQRSDTVNDLSLLIRAQFGFVVSDTVLRNDSKTKSPIERRVHVLEMDVPAASNFGPDPQATGLANRSNPGEGKIYLGPHTAKILGLGVGDSVIVADPVAGDRSFVVEAVLPKRGFGVLPLDGSERSNIAIVRTGTLTTQITPPPLRYVIAISNENGSKSSTTVSERLERAFSSAPAQGTVDGQALPAIDVSVDNVKAEILQSAAARSEPVNRLLKTLALLFSIGAALLLITLFFGLALDRVSEVGALRSVGLRRRDAISAFGLEGWYYAAVGSTIGAVAGVLAAVIALRSAGPQTGIVTVQLGPELRALWIALACGFVLSGSAIATSMFLVTRGTIQRAFWPASDVTETPALSKPATVGFGVIALFGAMTMLRSLDSRGSFGFLGGALLLVSGALPFVRRMRVFQSGSLAPRRSRVAIALGVMVLSIGLPIAIPGWFRHTGVGTTLLYASVLLAVGSFLASSVTPRFVVPSRGANSTAGGRRAAKTVANASPSLVPNRDLLLRATTAALVMALTTISCLRVGINNELADRTKAAIGGWQMMVSTADPADLASVAQAIVDTADAAPVSSLDVEVTNEAGRAVRVRATQIGPDYFTRASTKLTARADGLADDAAVYQTLSAEVGSVIVDRSLFVDGGTRLHSVTVGTKLFVRDLRSGRTQTLNVIGVSRSLVGLGHLLLGLPTASSLRGSVFAPDRILLAAKGSTAASQNRLKAAVTLPNVSLQDFSDIARGEFSEAITVLNALGWLMWLGGLLVVGALSVLMIRAASERKRDWAVLRSLGMSSYDTRRIAVSECLQLLAPAVLVGLAVGLVAAWHLVWAGSLGVDPALPFSVLSIVGALTVVIVPLVAVNQYLKRALANDAPMRVDTHR